MQELIIKICILLVIAYAILIPLQAKFINLWNSSRTGSIEVLVVFIHPGATVSASCLPRHSSQSLRPRQGKAISGSKLNSQVNKVNFPHFARKLIIAATFYQLHEYNKLNLQWNKRNAIYFTVEFHAGIHLISIILGDELRY